MQVGGQAQITFGHSINEVDQVVRFVNVDAVFHQDGFEQLFGSLLKVEPDHFIGDRRIIDEPINGYLVLLRLHQESYD